MEVRKKRFTEGIKRLVVEELNRLAPHVATFISVDVVCKRGKWLIYYSADFQCHNEFERKYKNQLLHRVQKRYCVISDLPIRYIEIIYLGAKNCDERDDNS